MKAIEQSITALRPFRTSSSALAAAALSTCLGILSVGTPAQAQSYSLSIVAQSGDIIDGRTLSSFASSPSVNDADTVAFFSIYPGFGGHGIFTQTGLVATQGTTIGGKTLTGLGNPSLNNTGTVAFDAGFNGGSVGIFTQNALLVATGDTIGGKTLTNLGSPSLNDSGAVGFFGLFADSSPNNIGIFTQNALIAAPGNTVGGTTTDYIPQQSLSLNNNGTVAFVAYNGTVSVFENFIGLVSGRFGIFTQDGLLVAEGDTIGGKTITSIPFYDISLNNSGSVAFLGNFSGGSGVFTQNSLLAATGDTIDGKTLTSFGSNPSLNDNGTAVFLGNFSGGSGIFTQSSLLAATGDTVGGKTITGFSNDPSLTDNGAAAFLASFSDGSTGVVLATPVDSDGDGVPDANDLCPNTPAGQVVNRNGCSVSQLVPCDGPRTGGTWKNHGQYVSAVAKTAREFRNAAIITPAQTAAIVSQAAQSDCGR